MKKLVSLLLVAMMLITAVSAFADEAADKAKHPALGGFDWNPYDSDGKKSNGIGEKGIPGWLAARIQKKPVENGFIRYPFNPYYDCCIYCVIADCDCYCGFDWYDLSWSVYGYSTFTDYLYFDFEWCGIAGCWCMDWSTDDVDEVLQEDFENMANYFYDFYFDQGMTEEDIEIEWLAFLDYYFGT